MVKLTAEQLDTFTADGVVKIEGAVDAATLDSDGRRAVGA